MIPFILSSVNEDIKIINLDKVSIIMNDKNNDKTLKFIFSGALSYEARYDSKEQVNDTMRKIIEKLNEKSI